ncbi:MAG TPA: ABC transporter permease [Acidimicrobiales bacterium]|nr:ABC transporter permease [Acidimicrobiales bacterium]
MLKRAALGAGVFLTGFVAIVLVGKGVGGYLPNFMSSVVPNGIFLQGLVLGALNGLLAIGLVLIYRTNRIINFAQGELGAFAATLAAELVQRYRVPFYAAVAVGLVAAVLSSALIEFAIIRRFTKAPRLILTVVTIGVAQILGAVELAIPALLNKNAKMQTGFQTPLSFGFNYGGVQFRGDHIVVMIITPVVIAGLVWFMRRTGYGLAARAAADDRDRARLLGVPVKRVSLIVWSIAGGLSALTAVLSAPITGFQFGALGGYTLLAYALGAAVIGRFESLPITFGAALLISLAQQVLFFGTGHSGPDFGLVFAVILVALLIQRRRTGRLETGASTWQAVEEVRPVPRELRRLPEVRYGRWGLAGLALALGVVVPFVLTPSRTSLATDILIYAMVGISLVILTGWGGHLSFGQWALAGVGGLVAGHIAASSNPQDFFVTLLIAGAAGAAAALLIGIPALRIQGLFLGVTTLAFAVAAGNWIFSFGLFNVPGAIQRPLMFGVWDVSNERSFYLLILAFLVVTLVVARNLRNARMGRVLVAMRDNEKAAQSLGVPRVRTKLAAFAASGFIAAVAGALYAYHQQQLTPERFPADLSVFLFSMIVIGGMGSTTGAVLGAIVIRGIQYFLPYEFSLLGTGFGVVLLLLFFPGGLGQLFYMARDALLRTVAERRGVLVPSLVADRKADTVELDDTAVARAAADLTEHAPEPELVTTGGQS